MAHLDSMGPPLAQAKYEVDYACTRLNTTPDGAGSVFVYRPLKNMGIFFRGRDQQPGISCQPMVFSGCVIEMSVMVRSNLLQVTTAVF
jgi:hypothetical protein